jgi:WD40 repeat protein
VAGFERDLGALDGVVWLWDVATGRELRRLGGRQQDVWAVAFSPDGKLLATAGNDNLVRLFDPATGAERISMPGHCGPVDVVALSPDGLVAVTGDRQFLRIWDAVRGNELHRMTGAKGEGARSAFFSGDGKRLITGHDSGTIGLWDVTTGRELAHPAVREKASWRGRFLADGRVVAAGNTESRLYVWDVAARKAVAELPLMEREVYPVALCPDCRRVAYGAMGAEIRLWDLGRKKTRQFIEPAGMVFDRGVSYLDSVGELVFSEDGKSLLTRTHRKGVRLWEVSTGKERLQLKASLDNLWSLALSPDGLTIASGAWGGDVRLWDTVTGNELFSSPAHRGIVKHVSFSANGSVLVSASYDTTALIWDVQRLLSPKRPGNAMLTTKDIPALWADLASPEARKAYLAIHALRAGGPLVATELAKHLVPVESSVSEMHIARLIRDLDSDRFATRQAADRELDKLGAWVEPHIRRRLEERPSLECRQGLESLLDRIEEREKHVPDPETLQKLRAVEVLEHLGTLEAKQCLMRLREGAPGARLTQEAQTALGYLPERLNSRKSTGMSP